MAADPALASVQSEIAFHRGVVAYGNGQLDAAQAAFEAVLEEDAEDTATLHYLGLIAVERGEPANAVEWYRRALILEPDDIDLHFDLGTALLEAGNTAEARSEFDTVLAAEPGRANAHLFAGIAAYRAAAYREALPHLDSALKLDDSLRAQARYYAGLCQASLQDFPAAAGAFADAEQSPLSPLSESAQNLGAQVAGSTAAARRWDLAVIAGLEFDSNPTIAGGTFQEDSDGRGVYRIQGSVRAFERGRYSVTAGYDGYLSTHFDETFFNFMTHVGHVNANANFDPVRLGMRYDYGYTFIDTDQKYRTLQRFMPTITVAQGNWGMSQLYYQFHIHRLRTERPLRTTFVPALSSTVIGRDGHEHVVGFNQLFYTGSLLPDYLPIRYFRIGALGDFRRTDGSEFEYDGWEFSAGLGAALPWEVDLSLLYRLAGRGYRNPSMFTTPPLDDATERRDDLRHQLTFELTKSINQHWRVSGAGRFVLNDSDVALYDHDRLVVGAYVTYLF